MESKDLMPIPQILTFDCSDDVNKGLFERHYYVKKASFGKNVNHISDRKGDVLVPIIIDVPKETHEFDIIIVDMCGVKAAIDIKDLPENYINPIRCYVKYPNDVFYTSAISSRYIFKDVNKPMKAVYIIFEGDYFRKGYRTLDISDKRTSSAEGGTYDFFSNIYRYGFDIKEKHGFRTSIVGETKLSNILYKYNETFQYYVTIKHPIVNDNEGNRNKRKDFIPLVLNDDGEIVSFVFSTETDTIIVLPQTERKKELIIELLEDFLPSTVPEFFPESTKFLWLSDQKYALPNANTFEERKQAVRDEYEAKVKKLDEEIQENNEQFGFLHDLLKETDDLLVKAVVAWFEWLGFQNVIDVDQAKGTKQEDIDIIEDDYVFIAEVKGIGGTSTDSECSQINKHRRRHEKANRGKEIHPIYIVNHQRFISPELRSNPPFTKDQIDYAANDERGLVTTYQLFIWYKLVSEGLFCKDEIREVLRQLGSIPLVPPHYKLLGTIKEYLPKPSAFIIDLDNVKIKAGDRLLFVKELDFQKADIQSIQNHGKPVESMSSGVAGVVVDAKIGKGYSVYLCPKTKGK